MSNSYQVVRDFEQAVASFAGCKFAVAVDSCTSALFLCCKFLSVEEVTLPSRTYPSVPCSVIHAGGQISFDDRDWQDDGFYRLEPYPIYDAAFLFEKDMYQTKPYHLCGGDADLYPDAYICISFSATKPINIGKGGMILTNNEGAIEWFKQARYCGRHEKPLMNDQFEMLGWNMYMTPEQAARGLLLMNDIEGLKSRARPSYPDLSQYPIYTKARSS